MEEAGSKLKRARERLGLRYRDVEEASARIAERRGNDEYLVALSRLADIENKGTIPSFYRMYSLCAIYRLDLVEVLSWYDVNVSDLPADADVIQHSRTHAVSFQADDGSLQAPLSLDPGLDMSKTAFLSRLIQRWGRLPLMLLNNVDLTKYRYGLIGTNDWSMFPIVPPGSLIVVDDTKRRIATSGWSSEHDRPIYFFEHRGGYACSWCTLKGNRLILQPHPISFCEPESFAFPEEIEVIGQVTHVAMQLGQTPLKTERS